MPDKVRLRAATAADIPTLVALVREYWAFENIEGFDPVHAGAVLESFFANAGHGCAWIARQGDEPVGYLLACFVFSLEHGGLTAVIDELYLVPEHRGSGIGRRLLEAAEGSFHAAGCTSISLEVGRGNSDARAFYGHSGFADRDSYEQMFKILPAHRAAPGLRH